MQEGDEQGELSNQKEVVSAPAVHRLMSNSNDTIEREISVSCTNVQRRNVLEESYVLIKCVGVLEHR